MLQGNAARSSNIQEITLEHIDNAKSSKEYITNGTSAMVVASEKYKTSLIYGEKLLVIPGDVWVLLMNYIKHMRPLVIQDDNAEPCKRFLFTSTRQTKTNKKRKNTAEQKSKKMTTSLVSSACSTLFEKSGFCKGSR